jgi:vacuolar iron transporter family protein
MNFKIDGKTISDIIIGMSDGLTVPFALAAGLAGAIAQSNIVLTAGLAELAAGGISMGLGGYLAAKSEADTYEAELRREKQEIVECPEEEIAEVRGILAGYGLEGDTLEAAVKGIIANREGWAQFMMKEELGLEKPHPEQALKTAFFIGGSYIVGGIVPLIPYAFGLTVKDAFYLSIFATSIALIIFGAVKGKFTSVPPLKGALETFLVGSAAAFAAYSIARLVQGH